MQASEQIDKLIAEQAAEWTERLARGDEGDRAAFAQWSRKSPQHMRQFLMMMALDQELTRIDPDKRIEMPSATGAGDVVSLGRSAHLAGAQADRSRRRNRWAMAAALAVVSIGAALYFGLHHGDRQDYYTARGEQRAIELGDGSILHLNTQTRVQVRLSAHERNIHLLAGEALFKVAKDKARPFRVHTDDAVVQAIGTQFNVYAQSGGTKVSVLEGRVRVSSQAPNEPDAAIESLAPADVDLGAGDEARVDAKGLIKTDHTAEVTAMAAWRQRRLVFDRNTLSEVIAEFNRYNRAPQFRLMEETLATRPYSGAFDADDTESLLELLRLDPELELETGEKEVRIRKR